MLQLKRHKTRVPYAAKGSARGGEVDRRTHHRVRQGLSPGEGKKVRIVARTGTAQLSKLV